MAKQRKPRTSEIRTASSDAATNVLMQIDRLIFKPDLRLDSFLREAGKLISEAYGLKRYGTFCYVDHSLIELDIGKNISAREISNKISSSNLNTLRVETFDSSAVCIIIPYINGSALIWFFDLSTNETNKERFLSASKELSERLDWCAQYATAKKFQNAQRTAYELFFNHKLKPSACWRGLLDTLDSFLPDLQIGPSEQPHVRQLLTFTKGDNYLRIAAGQGSENSNFVLVDGSVSGLLIKTHEPDFLLANPQEHSKLYKGYGTSASKTELAIRLDTEEGTVGIINIEHVQENAFNSLYVRCMRDAAAFLAPLVGGLEARYESFRRKEIALLYVFGDILSRMADTYGHLVGTPIFNARQSVWKIERVIKQGKPTENLLPELQKLSRAIDLINTHSDKFTQGLPEFISYGAQPLKSKIEQRLESFKKLIEQESITIDLSESQEGLCGYASTLFQEHIYNIVNNSFQQIRKGIFEGKSSTGKISIRIEKKQGRTPQNEATGIDFIDIYISDTGGGASPTDLTQIGRPTFTTKLGGSGFGVAAAKEYFQTVGGDMTWGNIKNGFQTKIRLQEFKDKIHIERKLSESIREEAMK